MSHTCREPTYRDSLAGEWSSSKSVGGMGASLEAVGRLVAVTAAIDNASSSKATYKQVGHLNECIRDAFETRKNGDVL